MMPGPGLHLLGLLGFLVFWVGVVVLVVWAIRSFTNRPAFVPPPPPAPPTPRQILDERLARGETTVADYEKARAALEKNP
jgi:uncharacterized membrane protein